MVFEISQSLTLILTHKQWLEREFDILCNETGFNPFKWLDQNLGLSGVNSRSTLVKVDKNL